MHANYQYVSYINYALLAQSIEDLLAVCVCVCMCVDDRGWGRKTSIL